MLCSSLRVTHSSVKNCWKVSILVTLRTSMSSTGLVFAEIARSERSRTTGLGSSAASATANSNFAAATAQPHSTQTLGANAGNGFYSQSPLETTAVQSPLRLVTRHSPRATIFHCFPHLTQFHSQGQFYHLHLGDSVAHKEAFTIEYLLCHGAYNGDISICRGLLGAQLLQKNMIGLHGRAPLCQLKVDIDKYRA